MARYIRFEAGNPIDGKPAYRVLNKRHGDLLAAIYWYPLWRTYIFHSSDEAVWSQDCLADVQAFMAALPQAAPETPVGGG